MSASIPLHYRVPNPPAVFVGRAPVLRAVRACLNRAPACLIHGPTGIGKTATASAAVTQLDGPHVYLALVAPTSLGELLRQLARRLDLEATVDATMVLDGAERHAAAVLIDDAHHLGDVGLVEWFSLCCRFARRSRWIFTSQARPAALSAPEQAIELQPLSVSAARALAKACLAGAPPGPQELVELAGRYPATIRAVAMSTQTASGDVLAGLSTAVIRQIAASALAQAQPTATAPDLEGVVGQLKSQDPAGVRAVVAHHQAWLEAGHARRLWRALQDDRALPKAVKQVIAVAAGTPTALAWLSRQPVPTDDSRWRWVRGMLQSGNPRAALRALPRRPSGRMQRSSRLLMAEAFTAAGRSERALRMLDGMQPSSVAETIRHQTLRAGALYLAGKNVAAKAAVEHAQMMLPDLGGKEADQRFEELAEVDARLGYASSARLGGGRLGERGMALRGARLALAGRLDDATQVLRTLAGDSDLPEGVEVMAMIAEGILWVIRGRYADVPALADRMLAQSERLGNATLYHWAFLLERLVNLSDAPNRPEPAWSSAIPLPVGIPGRYLAAVRACHQSRRGEIVAPASLPRPQAGDGPLVAIACGVVRAQVDLLEGRGAQGVIRMRTLLATVRRERLGFAEAELLLVLCYAALAADDTETLATSLAELEQASQRLRSQRCAVLCQLLRLADAGLDAAQLLVSCQAVNASPTAARVASTLLGGPASADAIDALLVRGISRRWGEHAVSLVPSQTPVWVIDSARQRVHLPGRTETLSPLAARLLACLFEATRAASTGASLEHLALTVWGVTEFHPLRDSKRVHVAVRRLRTVIEEVASEPARVLTVDGGYALRRAALPGRVERHTR